MADFDLDLPGLDDIPVASSIHSRTRSKELDVEYLADSGDLKKGKSMFYPESEKPSFTKAKSSVRSQDVGAR